MQRIYNESRYEASPTLRYGKNDERKKKKNEVYIHDIKGLIPMSHGRIV